MEQQQSKGVEESSTNKPAEGITSDLLDFAVSFVTPGYHHRFATYIVNGALLLLTITLAYVIAFEEERTVHHWVLLGMAVCLMGAINWLLATVVLKVVSDW